MLTITNMATGRTHKMHLVDFTKNCVIGKSSVCAIRLEHHIVDSILVDGRIWEFKVGKTNYLLGT
jgi:hypothetical protein